MEYDINFPRDVVSLHIFQRNFLKWPQMTFGLLLEMPAKWFWQLRILWYIR